MVLKLPSARLLLYQTAEKIDMLGSFWCVCVGGGCSILKNSDEE